MKVSLICVLACFASTVSGQELARAGFIGVLAVAVPDTVREQLALPTGVGVMVKAVVDGGSAKAAGVLPDDVITQVGDRGVTSVDDFVQIARRLHGGDTRVVGIRRGAQALELKISILPRPFEAAPDIDTKYEAVSVDGTLRRTIITVPKSSAPFPAVLYVNGIGCFSQESLDLTSNDTQLLYGLARAGYVTMRVEKSNIGDSQGPPCASSEANFDAEIRAYTAGLRALKRMTFVDINRVFVIGLSIGGVEAPLIAAKEPVRGLIIINTVGRPLFEYLLDTRRRQMQLAHRPHDETDRLMALDERCNHRLLIDKEPPTTIIADLPVCADFITYPAPFTFMQQWADVNIAAAWKAINRPVLVVYGTSDYISSIGDDPYLVEMINSFHPDTATSRAVVGMDHTLNKAASMADSFDRKGPGQFEPAVLEAITGWLRAFGKDTRE